MSKHISIFQRGLSDVLDNLCLEAIRQDCDFVAELDNPEFATF